MRVYVRAKPHLDACPKRKASSRLPDGVSLEQEGAASRSGLAALACKRKCHPARPAACPVSTYTVLLGVGSRPAWPKPHHNCQLRGDSDMTVTCRSCHSGQNHSRPRSSLLASRVDSTASLTLTIAADTATKRTSSTRSADILAVPCGTLGEGWGHLGALCSTVYTCPERPWPCMN